MSQITNYQCPACTGPLHFDTATGKLSCEYCDSSFEVTDIEAMYSERNARAEAAGNRAETAWKMGDAGAEWGEDAANMRAYNCPSCGAQLICDVTTAADSCPYCGNPTVVPAQFGKTRKPDYVIPFKLDKNAAIAALKKHYKGKPLLPKSFASENHLQEIKGVYVPFWLFDGKAEADITFKCTRSHVRTTSNERITTTEHFVVERGGTVAFERVPVDGSTKMPDTHMDAIEPFDYSELKPFAMGYLPGFLADRYDVDEKESARRADERCRASAIDSMAKTVVGYSTCVPVRTEVDLQRERVQYALLPVWLLNTKWKDKDYLFAMNGQTGKLIGDLPVSWGKFWAIFAAIFIPIATILGLLFL